MKKHTNKILANNIIYEMVVIPVDFKAVEIKINVYI